MMSGVYLSNWLAVEEPKFTRKKKGALIVSERDDGAWYVISVAAIKAEVHEQTLRHYERLGLISPARKGNSPHSPRLYSDTDIERVIHIRGLMRDLGVNLAGVEAILYMKDRMEQMQLELEQEMARIQDQHVAETRRLKDIIERLQRGSSS
jgi:MerR family transcriptional regulator/heat shock protein HspR